MGNYYIQEVERIDRNTALYSGQTDRVELISYSGSIGILRSFKSMKELGRFATTLGFRYQLSVSTESDRCGVVNTYDISHIIVDKPTYFWSLDELPPNAKKVTLTENGADVTCYFINDGQYIYIFRPNCNAKEVYRRY